MVIEESARNGRLVSCWTATSMSYLGGEPAFATTRTARPSRRSLRVMPGATTSTRTASPGSIAQLVELSGEASPAGPSLLAEVNGEPWAALSLHDGQLLSDPFHPSVELGSLLTLRLAQLAASPRTLATPRSA